MKVYKNKFQEWMIIISLLAINIVETSASVITATIPGMAKTFSDQSLVNVELVTTIVSVFITIFVLLSGVVVKQIGQKNTAILGLIISSISSIVPFFSNNFTIILVSRAIMGIGIGLTNPLGVSMISVFFFGDQRTALMGWRMSIAGIGTAIMTYFAGVLLRISWHAAYLVYLLFVPALILFIIFVPSPEKSGALAYQEKRQEEERQTTLTDSKQTPTRNPKFLIGALIALAFIYLAMGMTFAVKLPTYFIEAHIGTATQASTTWSFCNIASVIGGFIFVYLYKKFKNWTVSFCLVVAGTSLVLISFIHTITIIRILAIFVGINNSIVVAFIFTKISEITTAKSNPLYTSLALVGTNFGSFISPYAGKLLGSTSATSIMNAGIVLVCVAVIAAIMVIAGSKRHIKALSN